MITERELSYADMQGIVSDGHVCGECGGRLTTAWVKGEYVLRCGNDIEHNTITRHDPEYDKRINEIRRVRKMDSIALVAMTETKMMERVNMARFPQDLTLLDKKLLAKVAITYGFDPLMGEVIVYQGRPYVSIDGRYRKAQETNELDGVQTRPATKQECKDWEIPEDDYFFHADVYRKGCAHPFEGWGRVRKAEVDKAKQSPRGAEFLPIATNPQRQAEKRAEAQGLRKGFHIPLPSIEDIGGEEELADAVVEASSINPDDIPWGQGTDVDNKVNKRDPATVQNIAQLQIALFKDFNMQPDAQKAELNIKSWGELTLTPAEAYTKVAGPRQ